MSTQSRLYPLKRVVRGEKGFWGASPRLIELTGELLDAIRDGRDRAGIIREIDGELLNESAPTQDEMDFDEDAYWDAMRERQEAMWEA